MNVNAKITNRKKFEKIDFYSNRKSKIYFFDYLVFFFFDSFIYFCFFEFFRRFYLRCKIFVS